MRRLLRPYVYSVREYSLCQFYHMYYYCCHQQAFDFMTTTSDSVSAGTVMCFAARIVLSSFCSCIGGPCNKNVVKLGSVTLPDTGIGAKCSGTFLHSMGNISRMHLSIYVVQSSTFTAMRWTIPNQFRTCGSPISTTRGVTT